MKKDTYIEKLLKRYDLVARAEGKSPKTVSNTRTAITLFDSTLGGITDVRKITAEGLRSFILALEQRPKWAGTYKEKTEKISRTAVNTYVRAVKAFRSWLDREKIIDDNPLINVRPPKLPKRLPKVISEREIKDIFEAVADSPRDKALIFFLLDSGITLSEVAELDDANVDTNAGKVLVFREKTQKERYAYFSAVTGAAIEAYRFVRPEPVSEARLFRSATGKPLAAKGIQQLLLRVGHKAHIKQRLSSHKLRHSFATWSLKYGSNLEYIRIMLGHSNIGTTSDAYLHMPDDDIARFSQQSSPVANLGAGRVTRQVKSQRSPTSGTTKAGRRAKKRKKAAQSNTVIIIQQPQGQNLAQPDDGIMPVSYVNKPKKRK